MMTPAGSLYTGKCRPDKFASANIEVIQIYQEYPDDPIVYNDKNEWRKKRVKNWPRGKKKAREPLRSKASRGFCDQSNSMVAKCFLLYMVVVLAFWVLYLYIFFIFHLVFGLFVSKIGPL